MKRMCLFAGCGRNSDRWLLCSGHRAQKKRGEELRPLNPYGFKPLRPLLPNPTQPGTLLVPLTQGRFAIIDEADGPAVGAQNWQTKIDPKVKAVYAVGHIRGDSRKLVRLHRFLWRRWDMPETPEIDHHNLNGLDCRRENLRAATSSQNKLNRPKLRNNRSGFKGVSLTKEGDWRAVFMGKYLGQWSTKEEAAIVYAEAARAGAGEFALVDVPPPAA